MQTTELYGGKVKLDFDRKKHRYYVDEEAVPSVTQITKIIDKSAPLSWWAANQAVNHVEQFMERTQYQPGEVACKATLRDARRAHLNRSGTEADIGTIIHRFAEDTFTKGQHVRLDGGLYVWDNKRTLDGNLVDAVFCSSDPRLSLAAETVADKIAGTIHPNADRPAFVETIDTEFRCYSQLHRYAGTVDLDVIIEWPKTQERQRILLDWKTSKAIYPEYLLQLAAYKMAREEELGVKYDGVGVCLIAKDDVDRSSHESGWKLHIISGRDIKNAEHGFLSAKKLHEVIKGIKTIKL